MNVKRGILRAFDQNTYKATVQMHGSLVDSADIPVSRAISAAQMTPGRAVAVLQFWPNDPQSDVVAAVWE